IKCAIPSTSAVAARPLLGANVDRRTTAPAASAATPAATPTQNAGCATTPYTTSRMPHAAKKIAAIRRDAGGRARRRSTTNGIAASNAPVAAIRRGSTTSSTRRAYSARARRGAGSEDEEQNRHDDLGDAEDRLERSELGAELFAPLHGLFVLAERVLRDETESEEEAEAEVGHGHDHPEDPVQRRGSEEPDAQDRVDDFPRLSLIH